ncbi:serine hydrolase domain-containing protein [Desertivirga xinjiangensis]|uniref:serine hydrolase domain-containing protein n=1 Tax=Desertivirga xinjiangensis TaxID=539206 RepID=UPI00210EBE59|nr:serine hydrolase [Pedobacter xinjiangensis]
MNRKYIKDRFLLPVSAILLSLVLFVSAEVPKKSSNVEWLRQMEVTAASMVLLNNQAGVVPLENLSESRIASVNLGSVYSGEFDSILNKYAEVKSFSAQAYERQSGSQSLNKLSSDLKFYNIIIVQVNDVVLSDAGIQSFLADLDSEKDRQLIITMQGDARSLKYLDSVSCPILWTSDKSPVSANYGAQAIFGGAEMYARLPYGISEKFKLGDGYSTTATRLKYTVPEELGIDGFELETSINKIMAKAIAQRATPGAAVMVVKDGKVIFNKAYGSHTYSNDPVAEPDKVEDIFDLASVTKVSATTIAAMRLYEQGKLDLDESLGTYFPLARSTSKNSLSIKELMLHEAGLTPFIPFYSSLKPTDHSSDSSSEYSVKVADGYYLRSNYYEDVMLPRMLTTRLESRGRYEYSDLSMYFIKEVIERQSMNRLDQYVLNEFYKPLGMHTAGFNPRNRFDKSRIVPTENDTYFRKTLVAGYVHDQGAAMAGGVAGHAGLFASANDLAILFQMLLNGGTYGGLQYFNPNTISLFTSKQSSTSRRGLGFDRWNPATGSYPSELASPETYGHTGFTGTCVWVDPKFKLIYIFLSNRVHEQTANKLSSMNIRPAIQDAVYKAILKAQ